MNRLPDIHKIAVLRATNLGDYIAALPALEALRAAYPQAEIVYLGKPFHQTLVKSRPGPIDRAIVIPISRGIRYEPQLPELVESQAEIDAFLATMQTEQFDLAIQMHGGGENTNPFVKRLGARFTAGMRTPNAPELDRWLPYIYYQNEVLRLLELVQLVGAPPRHYEPRLAVTAADHLEVRQRLPELRPPYVVLHPGASDIRRRWPPERFTEVGDTLAKIGFQVVITGVSHEREVAEQVIKTMVQPAVNAVERLALSGLIGLIDQAALVISNDTGPMHVANAVQTPNIGIFWYGNAFIWAHAGRRHHRPLMSWTMTCPLCGQDMRVFNPPRDRCQHEVCFVDGVTVAEVLDAAFDLLAYTEREPVMAQAKPLPTQPVTANGVTAR